MIKTNKFWITVIGAVVILCAGLLWRINNTPGYTAHIYVGNELYEIINLKEITELRRIVIENGGGINIVEAEYGRIRMNASNCRRNVCIHQGWVSNSLTPIVCLPNNILIKIDSSTDDSDIDGVVR